MSSKSEHDATLPRGRHCPKPSSAHYVWRIRDHVLRIRRDIVLASGHGNRSNMVRECIASSVLKMY